MRFKLIIISISAILASVFITSIAQAQAVPFFGEAKNIAELVRNIFNFGVALAGIAAVLVIMIGGIIYIVSFGSEERQKLARDLMGGAAKGLLLALFSWTIFYILSPYLLRIRVPTLPVEPEYITPTYNPCIGQYVWAKEEKCNSQCQAQDFGNCTKGNTAGCKVSEVAVGPPCFSDEDCPYGYKCNTALAFPICEAKDLDIPVKTPPLEGWCCLPKGILACPTREPWPLVSCFGPRCVPAPGRLFHTGIDLACPENTPVLAAGDGTVEAIVIDSEEKYFVTIAHTPGAYGEVSRTRYGHLKSVTVSIGQEVDQYDQIGQSGTPSHGAHLHFEVYVGSPPKLTDPRPYLAEACFSSVCHNCSCDNYGNGTACPPIPRRCHKDVEAICK
jgi:hypothetical protein